MTIDYSVIKRASESLILAKGGEVCDWLPYHEISTMQTLQAVQGRALVLNAMINISFGAPIEFIKQWMADNNVYASTTARERALMDLSRDGLQESAKLSLRWSLESLWAIMWSMHLVQTLDFTSFVPNSMAQLCPNLQINENGDKFLKRSQLRDYDEVYRERDLNYRAMWYARHLELCGKPDAKFSLGVLMERRKGLDWVIDSSLDWDDMPQDT